MRICSFKFLISSFTFLLMLLAGCASVNRSQKFSVYNNSPELIQPLLQKEEQSFDYIICPEEVLSISIWQDKDLDAEVIVRPDGKISLQLIGEVKVSGKTLAELSEMLSKRYSTYINSPQVLVSIKKFGGTKVIILGQVSNPGVYKPVERVSLLEVIAMAGGLTDNSALNSVIVIRGGLENPEKMRLDLTRAIQKTDISQNITIEPNDIIYIPKKFIADVAYFFSQYLEPLLRSGIDQRNLR